MIICLSGYLLQVEHERLSVLDDPGGVLDLDVRAECAVNDRRLVADAGLQVALRDHHAHVARPHRHFQWYPELHNEIS